LATTRTPRSGAPTCSHSRRRSALRSLAVSAAPEEDYATEPRLERIRAAHIKGYEGDSCEECGNFTLIRDGTCRKCDTCGATSAARER